jgi:hypothetical protein
MVIFIRGQGIISTAIIRWSERKSKKSRNMIQTIAVKPWQRREIISIGYRPERARIIVPGSISFFMNWKFPGFIKSFALVDPISIFDALFLISRIERMIQSSVAISNSILCRAGRVLTDIFNGLYGTQLLLRNARMVYNTITIPKRGVPRTSNSPGPVISQSSDACRGKSRYFSVLRETVELRSTSNAKNQIILMIASGLVTIFPGFEQLKFYVVRS